MSARKFDIQISKKEERALCHFGRASLTVVSPKGAYLCFWKLVLKISRHWGTVSPKGYIYNVFWETMLQISIHWG